MWRFASSYFILGLLTTLYVHAANSEGNYSGNRQQELFGQAKHQTVAKASADRDNDDGLSVFDLTQDDPDVVHLSGLDIRKESTKLSMKMRHLSNEELRVSYIQVQSLRAV